MPKPLLNNIKAQRSLPEVFACTGLSTRDSAVFTQTAAGHFSSTEDCWLCALELCDLPVLLTGMLTALPPL